MEKLKLSNRRYLGSKAKLIPFIKKIVKEECGEIHSFLDVFAGTGVVGYCFNNQKTEIYVNDILECNYISYKAFFDDQDFDCDKILKYINFYNESVVTKDNYFSINFSDTFFSKDNCKKIGFIREDIENEFKKKNINEREKAILVTSLLFSMDRIANTVGHYDAYRMNGDLSKKLNLEMLDIPSNEINKNNKIYSCDANELVKNIYADVVYIDPPYNSRQYCDAYHLLENVARWEKPEVFGTAKKMDRSKLKSKYCSKSAPIEFDKLIQEINAKYIIVSYNNMGDKGAGRSQAKISDEDIISSLSSRGEVKVFEKEHPQFTTGKSIIENHKERLFVCKIGEKTKYINCNAETSNFVKSPLNYTGGKSKLLPQLLNRFPKNIVTFVDIFGGGFNVGANVNANNIVYNDSNKKVMRIIKLFSKYQGSTIIKKLDCLISKYGLSNSVEYGYEYYSCSSDKGLGSYNKGRYLQLRNDYNCLESDSEDKDFMLLALIIFGFNNQIRFNDQGDFNMPVGKRDLNSSTRQNIREFASKLKNKNIIFFSKDFSKIDVIKLDSPFVYCDPPYFLGTAAYNENDGWNKEDEIRLLEFLKKLDSKGIPFALSNVIEHKGQEHSLLKKWAEDNYFNIIFIKSNYSNSNYHIKNKNAETKEVLITNY